MTVGLPLSSVLIKNDATVTVFHSKSKDIDLSGFDVIFTAIGQPEAINPTWFKNGVDAEYIVDIGINVNSAGKLCGDVDAASFKDYDVKITPVPGGIGRLATVVLFAKLFVNSNRLNEGMHVRL
jgi:methylenetetrahydrofolate dehydrogenase (NADP+)/methenyltetrahydrofolate cyclohydrolase